MNQKNSEQELLPFIINGEKFEWPEEYIIGLELKELGKVPIGESLFLVIEAPWENELILDDTRINLARPGIEAFVSKQKHPDAIILTIETSRGKWQNVAFNRDLTVDAVIQRIIKKFEYESDGNYKLKIKGQDGYLDGHATLQSLHLKDHTILVFTDLGKGA